MLAFFFLLNIARFAEAEMLIHHAITQTAKEISAYSYIGTKLGITKQMQSAVDEYKGFLVRIMR